VLEARHIAVIGARLPALPTLRPIEQEGNSA
jgi:hypothetical protein